MFKQISTGGKNISTKLHVGVRNAINDTFKYQFVIFINLHCLTPRKVTVLYKCLCEPGWPPELQTEVQGSLLLAGEGTEPPQIQDLKCLMSYVRKHVSLYNEILPLLSTECQQCKRNKYSKKKKCANKAILKGSKWNTNKKATTIILTGKESRHWWITIPMSALVGILITFAIVDVKNSHNWKTGNLPLSLTYFQSRQCDIENSDISCSII